MAGFTIEIGSGHHSAKHDFAYTGHMFYKKIKINGSTLELKAYFPPHYHAPVYFQDMETPSISSFVITFGWCHSKDNNSSSLTASNLEALCFLNKNNCTTLLENLSGNYCMIVFNSLENEIWVVPDKWGQMPVYFGARESKVSIGCHSAEVAHFLESEIDGKAYISLLRTNSLPFGQSLFTNIRKTLCGHVIHIDLHSMTTAIHQGYYQFNSFGNGNIDELIDEFIYKLQEVVKRLVALPGVVFDLTAGNDTRLTLAGLLSSIPENIL